jgi:hypothetical protein
MVKRRRRGADELSDVVLDHTPNNGVATNFVSEDNPMFNEYPPTQEVFDIDDEFE